MPFVAADGAVAGEAAKCFNPNAAVKKAKALSHRRRGRLRPLRRSGHRIFRDAKVIRKFGDIPDDRPRCDALRGWLDSLRCGHTGS
jgi:hypothetical protein